ncbi:MAG: OmpA family protein, partial [Rhodobacterales bacterium]|nr:OmpA family protein [Rhodobacterales bacterium]
MVIRAALLALLAAALPAAAFSPGFAVPATLTADQAEAPGDYPLPLGPWAGGSLPVQVVEGQVTRRAWRLEAPGQTTLALLAPLRAALVDQGYTVLLDCAAEACGGFDFRFATPVLPEPEMHVDLGDFRFVAARRETAAGVQAVSLMVSRSATAGHVQIVTVDPLPPAAPA